MVITDDLVQHVWSRGSVVPPNDPREWRKDKYGAWMRRSKYGDHTSEYGWEIDQTARPGADALSNLRPVHWKNHVSNGNGRAKHKVTATGARNGWVR